MLGLLVLLLPTAQAAVNWGSATAQTYQMTYDTSTYADSLTFCKDFRNACIAYVGPLNYHHQVNCGASEKGPTIFNICAAVQKNADGTWSSGTTPCDFTSQVVGTVSGVTITGQPSKPYAACSASGASASSSNSDSSASDSDESDDPSGSASPKAGSTTESETTLIASSTTSDLVAASTTVVSSTNVDAEASSVLSDDASSTSASPYSFSASALAAAPSVGTGSNVAAADDSSNALRQTPALLSIVGVAGLWALF